MAGFCEKNPENKSCANIKEASSDVTNTQADPGVKPAPGTSSQGTETLPRYLILTYHLFLQRQSVERRPFSMRHFPKKL
jgi:hypothetical protein